MTAWCFGLVLLARPAPSPVPPQDPEPPPRLASTGEEAPGSFIDRIVEAQAAAAGVPLGRIADDCEFVRRLTLDLAGEVPDADAARAFVADSAPDKRLRLVERVLASEECDVRLARLLLNDTTGERASYVWFANLYEYYKWLRESLHARKGFDAIAREIVTARGQLDENGAVNFTMLHRVRPDHLTTAVAKVFLGSSLGCAQCHDHPEGIWKREQFWGVAAFFARTQAYLVTNGDYGITDSRFGRLAMPPLDHPDVVRPAGDVDPDRLAIAPRWLDGTAARGEEHLRVQLADFVVHDRRFALNFANRVFAWLMGRGVVEPRDRLDSPEPLPDLLVALADFSVAHHYDLRALLREIAASRTYQRVAAPASGADDAIVTHPRMRPLDVDQLFATLQRASGQDGTGGEACRVVDGEMPSQAPSRAALPSIIPYLKIIAPDSGALHVVDEPERRVLFTISSVDQFLPELFGGEPATLRHEIKRQNGMPNALAAAASRILDRLGGTVGPAQVEEVWWSLLSRSPTAEELDWTRELLDSAATPREGLADVFWAVWNSHEFSHNH